MPRPISDFDIDRFLRRNAGAYPSQVSLIQAAVRLLWPEGAPADGAERVVRVCLAQDQHARRLLAAGGFPANLPQPR